MILKHQQWKDANAETVAKSAEREAVISSIHAAHAGGPVNNAVLMQQITDQMQQMQTDLQNQMQQMLAPIEN